MTAEMVAASPSSLMRVRVAPLLADAADTDAMVAGMETVVDAQLIVDYTAALARTCVESIRSDAVPFVDHPHVHPKTAVCLRCLILGNARDVTLAQVLLELLNAEKGMDEDWNLSGDCTDKRLETRLHRFAVTGDSMAQVYGPHWGEVLLACQRIESSDFSMLDHLVQRFRAERVLDIHTRHSLAAYHLARVSCPWSTPTGRVSAMQRSAVATRLAVAAAHVSDGRDVPWLDHLPMPGL